MDAVVVGAGPNGLAAAIALARAGRSVTVFEAANTIGGGARSAELTLPGFVHDICSAIHPLALASPFFRSLPLDRYGLELIHPPVPLAHPFEDGSAALLKRSVGETARSLGPDGPAYERMFGPLVRGAEDLFAELMGPLRVPRHPFLLARFGLSGLRSVASVAESRFNGEAAKALLAGSAAHSMLTLTTRPTAAIALAEGALGHAFGWPLVRGGSQQLADALASYFESLGGTIVTEETISRMAELPDSPAVLFDLTPRQVLSIAGDELPHRYRRRLSRYRYGLGVFKVDLALSGPIPWKASECELAATLHVGGTIDEIAASEEAAWSGRPPERPFVLFAQQSLFDSTRAPIDKHTAWAYCHVPAGSTFDMTDRIEAQLERFAPGFKDLILERHVMSPVEMERYNPNYVGGDINGGVQDLRQLFTRPVARVVPYSTPNPRIFICSSSTPPGGGVHGMCGYFAARAVLRSRRTQRSAES